MEKRVAMITSLRVNVLTDKLLSRPSRIEVRRAGASTAIAGEDGQDEYLEEVGIEITDLTVMLFDESGKEHELPVRLFWVLSYMDSLTCTTAYTVTP